MSTSISRSRIAALLLLAVILPLAAAAAPFPARFLLSNLEPAHGGDGSMGVFVEDPTLDDFMGVASAVPFDLNGDGFDDVLLGAPRDSACVRCAAFVMFGGLALPPSFNVVTDPLGSGGQAGFIFRDLGPLFGGGGGNVSGIGDLNADGFDDFALTASGSGKAYVVFGRDTGYPPIFDAAALLPQNGGDGSEGFILSDGVGGSVSGGCDFNADGIDDLAFGNGSGNDGAGEVFVVFGRSSGFPPEFELAGLRPPSGDGSAGIVIEGTAAEPWPPGAGVVACIDDTNGDHVDDLVIGAPSALANTGQAFLVFGHAPPFPAALPLSALLPQNGGDGSAGVVFVSSERGSETGNTVASPGDMNGDGLADFAIGAPGFEEHHFESGRVHVLFGRAGGFPAVFPLAELLPENGGDGSEGFVLTGRRDDFAGQALSGAGDVNDDGFADLIVGAPGYDDRGDGEGAAYVLFGRASPFPPALRLGSLLRGHGAQGFVLAGGTPDGDAGKFVGRAGDVNADGVDDLIVSEPGGSPDEYGHAYVVYGRSSGN